MRVLIVGRYVPAQDGEWRQPLQYFKALRARGIEAWLVVLERRREAATPLANYSLDEEFPLDGDRLHTVRLPESCRLLDRLSRLRPALISSPFRTFRELYIQWLQRRVVCDLVERYRVDVVHQPVPQCPRQPSLIYGVGAPVVMGPLHGFLDPPQGLRTWRDWRKMLEERFRRTVAMPFQWFFPGKRRAAVLLVDHPQVRRWLPRRLRGEVVELGEGGVELAAWNPSPGARDREATPIRLVCSGRLVPSKAIDLLLEAVSQISSRAKVRLEILGDGPMLEPLRELADQLGLADEVEFPGWKPREQCARSLARAHIFVHSGLSEPGGNVLFEAMAMSLPIVAANWGGPARRVDSTCGLLVEPRNRQHFVEGLAGAILRLVRSPALRSELGASGRRKAVERFDYERRAERLIEVYDLAAGREL